MYGMTLGEKRFTKCHIPTPCWELRLAGPEPQLKQEVLHRSARKRPLRFGVTIVGRGFLVNGTRQEAGNGHHKAA